MCKSYAGLIASVLLSLSAAAPPPFRGDGTLCADGSLGEFDKLSSGAAWGLEQIRGGGKGDGLSKYCNRK
jgi:hypothetical protein